MKYFDILSRLGVATAHPGGTQATRRLLEMIEEHKEANPRLLEVGCGLGKTACQLAGKGYRVTALDGHPLMIDKARKRAEEQGVTGVEWVGGAVEELPFEDEAFDIVYAESVTIFTDMKRSVPEYARVLKKGGLLIDREMVLYRSLPSELYDEFVEFFELNQIPTAEEWVRQFRDAGFRCDLPKLEPFQNPEGSTDAGDIGSLDLSMLFDPEIGQGILRYATLMAQQEHFFKVGHFVAEKA